MPPSTRTRRGHGKPETLRSSSGACHSLSGALPLRRINSVTSVRAGRYAGSLLLSEAGYRASQMPWVRMPTSNRAEMRGLQVAGIGCHQRYAQPPGMGAGMLVLLLGVGIYFTVRTRGSSSRTFSPCCKDLTLGALFTRKAKANPGAPFPRAGHDHSAGRHHGHRQSGGRGHGAGGRPGGRHLLDMDIGIFGMMTKYAEVVLAVHFRERTPRANGSAAPCTTSRKGLRGTLAPCRSLFALFAACAAFGMGNLAQVNSIAGAIESTCLSFGSCRWTLAARWRCGAVGIGIALCVGLVLFGGQRRIGRMTECLIPFFEPVLHRGQRHRHPLPCRSTGAGIGQHLRQGISPASAAGGIF